jgi:hypothetical protein
MSNLTVQLVLKITPELDNQLDRAFAVASQRGSLASNRTDYVRIVLGDHCAKELANHHEVASPLVKDPILNKVIWTIISKLALEKCDGVPFRALHLDEFVSGSRTKVEEIFYYLSDNECCRLNKDYKGWSTIDHFDEEKLKMLALANFKNHETMDMFGEHIQKWNTDKGMSINDLCFTLFLISARQLKDSLSDCGLIITHTSVCHTTDFMKGMISDGPSEYTRVLWDVPIFPSREKVSNLYVTYPDIYVV